MSAIDTLNAIETLLFAAKQNARDYEKLQLEHAAILVLIQDLANEYMEVLEDGKFKSNNTHIRNLADRVNIALGI